MPRTIIQKVPVYISYPDMGNYTNGYGNDTWNGTGNDSGLTPEQIATRDAQRAAREARRQQELDQIHAIDSQIADLVAFIMTVK